MLPESFLTSLATAEEHANSGKNDAFLVEVQTLVNAYISNSVALVRLAKLLLRFGFSSQAKQCLTQAISLTPGERDVLLSLAQCDLQLGSVDRFQKTAAELLHRHPNDLKVISQLLHLLQYLPATQGEVLKDLAVRWGDLAIQVAGGPKTRPALRSMSNRPLRIGYVSADFCQHTVGILIKEVLAQHNPEQVTVHCYSAGTVKDWVTQFIASHSIFCEVTALSDVALVKQIESDQIDVLIDLSGHTGGSRLTAFAYRPAPVMMSMLGYYATTGLPYMDGMLLDHWHVLENTQHDFVEPIVLMPDTRWCFWPAFPAPSPAPPPCIGNGYITFGSFNNTLKYNPEVYTLWADLLLAIPHSRLILKWRTFNDPVFKQQVLEQFTNRGIDPSRIELRGPSFHMRMLVEYEDIDIALDPFPFSGGATSCEALYMGVPVITWPQNNVVSRQTYAFVSNIHHPEWVAESKVAYIKKATLLAENINMLSAYRTTLRDQMIQSPLMQVKQFTQTLELLIHNLYQGIYDQYDRTPVRDNKQ
jgi:predicted O-linked N-acetylglucosamine transferase (SPINDLY family)